MVKAIIIIKCWQCGKEETITEIVNDQVIDINLDKLCSNCNGGWMTKKELTLKKLLLLLLPAKLQLKCFRK